MILEPVWSLCSDCVDPASISFSNSPPIQICDPLDSMAGPDLILLLSNTTVAGAPGINGTQLIAILEQYTADVDALWMLLAAFMVFGMQIGFALVEAGSILTNLRSILMKNIFDVCLSALSWWVLGYSIAKVLLNSSLHGCKCFFFQWSLRKDTKFLCTKFRHSKFHKHQISPPPPGSGQ